MPTAWGGKKPAALLRRLRKCAHSRFITFSHVIRRRSCVLIILAIIFLTIIFSATKSQVSDFSLSQNQYESESGITLLQDEDFLGERVPQVVRISQVFMRTNDIFCKAQLDNGLGTLMHVLSISEMSEELSTFPKEFSSSLQSASPRWIPTLHSVSAALHMRDIVAPSFVIRLPIPLHPSIAKRSTARSLHKALGFSSRLQIPQNFSAIAFIYPARSAGEPVPLTRSILHMPAIEPYLWRLALPTAVECSRAVRQGHKPSIANDSSLWDACVRICDTMLIAYVAGCGPPGDSQFVAENEFAEVRLGRPFGCFRSSASNRVADVTRDIWRTYAIATCRVSRGLIDTLSTLRNVSWGIGERSTDAHIWLTRDGVDLLQKACNHTNWIF